MKEFRMALKKTKNYKLVGKRKIEENVDNWVLYLEHKEYGSFKVEEGLNVFTLKINAANFYKKVSKMGINKYIASMGVQIK